MSFNSLNKDELKEVAEFFNKDIVAADEDKGPSKKELEAALASDADGSDPVSWDDYKEIYLPAKESGQDKSKEQRAEEESARQAQESKEGEATKGQEAEAAKSDAEARATADEADEDEPDAEDEVLIKYTRKNPSYQAYGYLFTTKHPFASVSESVAEKLVRSKGFQLALPSEVKDYYN